MMTSQQKSCHINETREVGLPWGYRGHLAALLSALPPGPQVHFGGGGEQGGAGRGWGKKVEVGREHTC